MNLMFEESIRQGKLRPDFGGTDAYQVTLTLHGQVQDARLAPVPSGLQPRLRRLADIGVVETVGRGRGTRYLLAQRFHAATGQRGLYTRRRGLDREQNKTLLLTHIQAAFPEICRACVQIAATGRHISARFALMRARRTHSVWAVEDWRNLDAGGMAPTAAGGSAATGPASQQPSPNPAAFTAAPSWTRRAREGTPAG
jgi:hypothetical protein